MKKWYGSIDNRLEENRQFCETIEVGTGMTEYYWSDRKAYEVVEVKDQKHVKVRKYDNKGIGEPMSNDWELVSNENNPVYDMTKRGQYWYWTVEINAEILDRIEKAEGDEKFRMMLFLAHNDVDQNKLRAKGKITKYRRANVSFGTASYYHDYEF